MRPDVAVRRTHRERTFVTANTLPEFGTGLRAALALRGTLDVHRPPLRMLELLHDDQAPSEKPTLEPRAVAVAA